MSTMTFVTHWKYSFRQATLTPCIVPSLRVPLR